jgi:glycosyltransferase involved in cell wall biosynthesis
LIYVGLPVGSNFGWGILGKYVVLEMAKLADVKLIVKQGELQISDEIDFWRLQKIFLGKEEQQQIDAGPYRVDSPIIQSALGAELAPHIRHILPPYDVGFAVFEEDILPEMATNRARRWYRHLATGSTYCAEVLKQHGFNNISTVFHGVDTAIFHPREYPRELFPGKFVVFSGGKFEFRKGQDIVIRAYKVLQDRHPDVAFVNSWYNHWPQSMDTMAASTLIQYAQPKPQRYAEWMNGILASNGIDLTRVVTVGMRENRLLTHVYHQTDVGLFPNRAEGGTNMVMMEYMACGKPVVGSFNTGHKDVLRKENAVLIEKHRLLPMKSSDDKVVAHWNDPDLDETIEKLEWAYQNRGTLASLGTQAGTDMAGFTWKKVAEGLLRAIQH